MTHLLCSKRFANFGSRASMLLLGFVISQCASADQVTIDARDFVPYYGQTIYGESSAGNLTCTPGNGGINLFMAQVPLPLVELNLKQVAFWGGDFDANDATVQLFKICQAEFSASIPTRVTIGDASSSGSGGNYFAMDEVDTNVDDQNICVYMVTVQLGMDTNCAGADLSLARVRVRYDIVQQPVVDAMFKNSFEN